MIAVWLLVFCAVCTIPVTYVCWREATDRNQPDPRLAQAARLEALRQKAMEAER